MKTLTFLGSLISVLILCALYFFGGKMFYDILTNKEVDKPHTMCAQIEYYNTEYKNIQNCYDEVFIKNDMIYQFFQEDEIFTKKDFLKNTKLDSDGNTEIILTNGMHYKIHTIFNEPCDTDAQMDSIMNTDN